MKLAIFGGTGKTGSHLVQQALAAGHDVSLLARTPAKITIKNDNVKIIEGDILQPEKVSQVIEGADAVISVLGPTSNTADYQVSKGTQNILNAMEQHQVQRLVISAGAGVRDPNDAPTPVSKIIGLLLKLFSRHVYEDMVKTVELVRESDVDWTIVRVPMLTNDEPTGEIKVGYVGKGTGSRIGRADMANFILKQVNDDSYLRQSPVISN